MTRLEALGLAAILVLYLALGALYAVRIPPYNAPDEPAHFNYVRDVAERRVLPVLQPGDWNAELLERLKADRFPPGSDVSTIRYESHQPPLYYLLAAPIAAATAPMGERGQLLAVRLFGVVVGALALFVLHRVARTLVPDATTRLAAVGLAAFIPMRLAVTSSVSNDGLAELGLSLVLWRSIAVVRAGVGTRGALALGALAGLATLVKLTDSIGIAVVVLALLLAPGEARVRRALIALGAAVVVLLPWLVRGAIVYGPSDPLGLRRHDEVVAGQPLTGTLSAGLVRDMALTTFHSFWGQFGWMGVLMDTRVYAALGVVSVLIGLGAVLWLAPWGGLWRELDPVWRRPLALVGFVIVGVALGMAVYNLRYLQPQGRYLFPAMAALAVVAAMGLRELVAERQRAAVYGLVVAALVALDLVALFRFILPDLGG